MIWGRDYFFVIRLPRIKSQTGGTKMQKAVIFGAGGTGRRILGMIRDSYDVLCFVDNDTSKYVGEGEQITYKAA